jgi:alpha-maltose-1-phosphate synthase
MACGCPVIASQNTGAKDFFTDGQEGFIVPIRSSSDILRALQQLADDPSLAANLRVRCMQRVRDVDGWDGYGRNWRSVIERLHVKK